MNSMYSLANRNRRTAMRDKEEKIHTSIAWVEFPGVQCSSNVTTGTRFSVFIRSLYPAIPCELGLFSSYIAMVILYFLFGSAPRA